jgi:Flp pilus assembly secretin CpaC
MVEKQTSGFNAVIWRIIPNSIVFRRISAATQNSVIVGSLPTFAAAAHEISAKSEGERRQCGQSDSSRHMHQCQLQASRSTNGSFSEASAKYSNIPRRTPSLLYLITLRLTIITD